MIMSAENVMVEYIWRFLSTLKNLLVIHDIRILELHNTKD